MSAPVARASRFRPTSARSRDGPSGSRVVTHREYVSDIAAVATPFTVSGTHVLNPGNPLLFPWLSTIALQYETYRFLKLRFVYTARTSTATPGSVIFTPDYDPADPPPPDLRTALTAGGSIESVPWKDLSVSLPTSKLHADMPHKFTRQVVDNIPSINKYDAGIFRTATSGFIAEAGHLWVEYSVLLSTPQLAPTIVGREGPDVFHMTVGHNLNEGDIKDQCPVGIADQPKTEYPPGWAPSVVAPHTAPKGNVTYDGGTGFFNIKPGTYFVEYVLDTITPGSAAAGDWYTFLQPFWSTVEGSDPPTTHSGPCESTSGPLADVPGRYQSVQMSEYLTFAAAATMQLGLRYIIGEMLLPGGGGGGGATQSYVGGASRAIFTRVAAAAA